VALVKAALLISLLLKVASGAGCGSLLPKDVVIPNGCRAVNLTDLPNDDQDLWKRGHAESCPGIAAGKIASGDRYAYAVALLKNDADGKLLEQFVVWLWAGDHFSAVVLVRPTEVVGGPFVVWRVPPGRSAGVDRRRPVSIAHDSFIYEKMEAIATQFYYVNGKFRTIQTAE
jgi:hypothetical protein